MVAPAERAPLTKRQQRIYDFIRRYIAEHGFAPSFRDIGAAFGIASANGVACHLRALSRKGYISRDEGKGQRGRSRTITLPETDSALSVEFRGARVTVTGRGRFSRAEWAAWLKRELARAGGEA